MPEEPLFTPDSSSPEPDPSQSTPETQDPETIDVEASSPTEPVEPAEPALEEWSDDIDPSFNAAPSAADLVEPYPQEDWDESTDWETETVEPPATAPTAISTREALSWLQPLWRQGLSLWRRLLTGLRARIPATGRLSDGVLSGILLGALVLLLVLFNSVQPSPSQAKTPSTPAAQPPPVQVTQVPESTKADRIAEIQAQLTDSSAEGTDGIVGVIEVDLERERLIVSLDDGWYERSTEEQQAIAQDLQARSLQLSLEDLDIRSAEGDLLARSPVVGKDMIIFKRTRASQ